MAVGSVGMAVAAPAPAAPPSSPTQTGANVALASAGAQVSVSGTEVKNKWQAAAAIDGDDTTRWSSNYSDRAWLAVHLAKPTVVDHVTIKWEDACAARYHLEVSNDGQQWTRASDTIAPTCGQSDTQRLSAAVAKKKWGYVKMQAEDRTPIGGRKWGVSLFEFQVWNGQAPAAPAAPAGVALVPQPDSLQVNAQAQPFVLDKTSRLVVNDDKASPAATVLAAELRAATGFKLPIVRSGATAHDVSFVNAAVPGYDSPEAYALQTSAAGAVITAKTAHGFFDGTRTLKQLLPAAAYSRSAHAGPFTAPAVAVKDAPRFAYRGVMIDPARSFLTVPEVKRIIDQLADLKMSRLHIHLTDDQGWRIQITNDGKDADDPIDYSRLTEVSGRMAIDTHEKAKSRELGRTGYYTQQEYRDIVAYGDRHFVTIVPEIDMPGHMNAALHAIPQLNTAGSSHTGTKAEPTAPENPTGQVGYSYLDPDSALTWQFAKHVLSQVAAMTTGDQMHIGGDEPFAMQKRYGQDKYNATLTRELQIVRDLHKQPFGWSEISDTKLGTGDTIHFWVGHRAQIQARVKQGAKVLMSLGPKGYLDQKYNAKTPLALDWACKGICDVRQYYDWNPINAGGLQLHEDEVVGTEAALWSETVRGGDQAEFLIWPRAAAHAEIGWTAQAKRNVNDFARRLSSQGPRWTVQGTNFYDTKQVSWDYSLQAPTALSARSAQAATLPLGQVAAPGTKLVANALSPDTVDDADGASASQLPAASRVSVDWGDHTPATTASLVAPRPRDAYGAPGLYQVRGRHTYDKPGTYTVTLRLGQRQATTLVRVAADAKATSLPADWDSSQKPTAKVGAAPAKPQTLRPGQRVPVSVSGFRPDQLVDIVIGDTPVGQFRPDDTGARVGQYLHVPAAVYNGAQQMTFTQGDRHASVPVTVEHGLQKLANPLPHDQLRVTDYDSQETSGETPPNGPAAAAIDGDPHTYWHTKWKGGADPFPHHITLGLPQDKTCTLTGFEYTPRADQVNGRARDFRLEASADGKKWTTVYTGTVPAGTLPFVINLDASAQRQAAFVRMTQLNSQAGNDFGGAAEVRVGAVCKTASSTPDKPVPAKPDKPAKPAKPDKPVPARPRPTYEPGKRPQRYHTADIKFPGNDGKPHTVTFDKHSFMIDGKRINIYSGEFHYWRLPDVQGWRDIFQKMRADGFNAVSLYYFWGLHQAKEGGPFDFTPNTIKDVDLLMKIAEQEGLYIIARPGPYINAEVSMGGLPPYMTNYSAGLRTTDPKVLAASKAWMHAIDHLIAKHQITTGGGSVIMEQVENELPSQAPKYESFLKELVKQVKADGITVPLFENDWGMGGRFRNTQKYGTDFYAYDKYPAGFNCAAARKQFRDMEAGFRRFAPNTPNFLVETQGGAFTPWGARFQASDCYDYTGPDFTRQWSVTSIANGVTAFNFYMIFGGTNWGWTGAPASGFTSYDYGAGLTEDRAVTDKFAVQKEMGYYRQALPQLAAMDPVQAPPVLEQQGDSVKAYQRQAVDPAGSATGRGTKMLAFRLSDSNSTEGTSFAIPLVLGASKAAGDQGFSTDDRSSDISYTGHWTPVADGEASQGTLTRSNTPGDKAVYRFTGTGIRVITGAGIKNGTFTVQVDDGQPHSVAAASLDSDQNKPSQLEAFKIDNLKAGEHTVTVTNTGSGTKTVVDLDAFDVLGGQQAAGPRVVNDTDSGFWTWKGSWLHASGKKWTAGDINKDESYSKTQGDTASFTFTGVGFDVIGPYSYNHGAASVSVDGKNVGKFSEDYAKPSTPQHKLFSWRAPQGAQPAQHTVTITVDGVRLPNAEDTFVSIDAVRLFTDTANPDKAEKPQDTRYVKPGQLGWERIPQQADTKLHVHGRDALLLTADTMIGEHQLYYTTSQLFGAPLQNAAGRMQYLVGYRGDPGETVLHYDAEPRVTLPEGATSTWDAKTGQLRLNYTHSVTPQTIVVTPSDGGARAAAHPLVLRIIDRQAARTTWLLQGNTPDGLKTTAVEGVRLARTAKYSGDRVDLTGSVAEFSHVTVYPPAGFKSVTWNGKPLGQVQDGVATGYAVGPEPVQPVELHFVKHADNAEAAPSYDDSGWTTAADQTAANPEFQGSGSNHAGAVLDSNHYGKYEGAVWYRASYVAAQDDPVITLKGNTGSGQPARIGKAPGFMQVWANGAYVGAVPAVGTAQRLTLSAGTVHKGQPVKLAVLVNNLGQNLDWNDNGLSKQNRGLFDAQVGNQGPISWKIFGATTDTATDAANNPSGTIYNNGGLGGERAGWHMPGFDDSKWAPAATLHSAPGVTWYRAHFKLNEPAGQETAYRLVIKSRRYDDDRRDGSQVTLFVNGWNTGVYIGDVGPQTSFTVPSAFLNPNGDNVVTAVVNAKTDTMGPEKIELQELYTTTLPGPLDLPKPTVKPTTKPGVGTGSGGTAGKPGKPGAKPGKPSVEPGNKPTGVPGKPGQSGKPGDAGKTPGQGGSGGTAGGGVLPTVPGVTPVLPGGQQPTTPGTQQPAKPGKQPGSQQPGGTGGAGAQPGTQQPANPGAQPGSQQPGGTGGAGAQPGTQQPAGQQPGGAGVKPGSGSGGLPPVAHQPGKHPGGASHGQPQGATHAGKGGQQAGPSAGGAGQPASGAQAGQSLARTGATIGIAGIILLVLIVAGVLTAWARRRHR